jgi:peptide/nickel transport system substrate-binding protein
VSDIDRRAFLKGAAALGAASTGAVLLDACGSAKATSTTKPPLSHKQAVHVGVGSGKPKMGGTVTFGTEAEEAGIDPTYAHFDSTGVMYARAVYDPLAIILFDGSVAPYLAESIVPNSNYTEWTITVRPNVVFHDGTPCDGQALLFCMREFLYSLLTNFAFTNYMDVKDPKKAVTLAGPNSITMHMLQPWVPFKYWLAGYIGGQMAYMFSPKQYMKGETVLNTHPVGTGPFKYVEWVPNSHFTLERNPHYWRKDRYGNQLPYLDGWTFIPEPDVDTRYESLQGNAIQLMHTDYDQVIQEIETNTSIDSLGDDELSIGEPDCDFVMVNLADPTGAMKDPNLRKAMAYATDQAAICQDLGKNIVQPIDGPFPVGNEFYSPTGYPEFSIAKAKSFLNEHIRSNGGKQAPITYTTTNSSQSLADASYMQAMWKNAGIDVAVKQVQQSALIDDALAGGYQMFSWRQFANVNPDLNYIFWASTSGPINFARNYDPIIQSELDRARQSADPSVQKTAYETIAKRLAVDLPYIWTNRDVWYIAARKNVENWNNPTSPANERGLTMLSGVIWPTEIWLS